MDHNHLEKDEPKAGSFGVILGLYWGYIRVIVWLYWDNGK